MMTLQQFLVLKLMEECTEVAQRCSKTIQFGPDEVQPTNPLAGTNSYRLHQELQDLLATAVIAQGHGAVSFPGDFHNVVAIHEKRVKLNKYLEYSRKLGLVEPGPLL